jgi:murein DD-endopeptidase MepM/ murein hydrolase activator NlpD
MMRRDDSKGRFRWVVRLLVLCVLIAAIVVTVRTGGPPTVSVDSSLPGIGRSTSVRISASAPGRGLSRLQVALLQNDRVEVLFDREYESRPAWAFGGPATFEEELELEVGTVTVPELEEGEATLRVEASAPGTWLRGEPSEVVEETYQVLLRPPTLGVASIQHYPAQGGCEVVVYSVGRSSVRDGVRAGLAWFPGYPLPGGSENQRMALFAVPFDLDSPEEIHLEAEDALGNTAQLAFVDKFFPRPFRRDSINVSDNFMSKVVPEIQANTAGLASGDTLVEDYVIINRDLRRENAQTLHDLARESRPEFLWKEAFTALPNGQVMSAFADRRTYTYAGEEIDQQDHLGIDLASVKRAPVPAANSGVVVLARYFGIYGNAVVIDHGFGLMSLYGHLSTIEVEEGQAVERNQIIGRTGETGLAAGDHLHFTMLLQGEAVTPIEWWDEKWIRDRLERKLGPALPFGE